jgi:Domain of unknown function (DUF4390)
MTMTAFISRCWRSTWRELAAWLACVCLLAIATTAAPVARAAQGEANATEISQLQIERSAEGVFLSATVRFELSAAVEDALLRGVPLFFVAEVDVFRDRWYWYDKKLVSVERHMRLAYQPLTRRWRLNIASGAITSNSLGLSLNQGFETLGEALAAMRRVSRWKIAEAGEIDAEQKNNIEFRFRLDVSQLPRPFQIGALGQADWDISATTTQRLTMQSAK